MEWNIGDKTDDGKLVIDIEQGRELFTELISDAVEKRFRNNTRETEQERWFGRYTALLDAVEVLGLGSPYVWQEQRDDGVYREIRWQECASSSDNIDRQKDAA